MSPSQEEQGIKAIIFLNARAGITSTTPEEAKEQWDIMTEKGQKYVLQVYAALKPEEASQDVCATCGGPLTADGACTLCKTSALL